jgi:hypothetical protein
MKALRLPTCASTVTYFVRFRRPRDPPVFVSASPDLAQRSWRNGGFLQARALGCRSPVVPAHFTWTPIGSLRYPGDPSCASAPLLDPGRTNVPLPWRSHRCCPRFEDNEGFGRGGFRGSLTQLKHLLSYASRFVSPLTRKAGFRLAGWPLPRGCRTLWTTTKGFRSHDLPPFLASWRYLDPP